MVVASIVSLASGIGMKWLICSKRELLYFTTLLAQKKRYTRQLLEKLHKDVVCMTRVHDGS